MQRTPPLDRLGGLLNAEQGLDEAQVARRRAAHEPNAILVESGAGWVEIARDTVRDPMIWFLVGTAGLFFWLGDSTEALALVAALLPIVGMTPFCTGAPARRPRGCARGW